MGGNNIFAYIPNSTEWVDPLGLSLSTPASLLGDTEKLDNARRADPNSGYYKGPFGGVCGAEGSNLATWIPDGYW